MDADNVATNTDCNKVSVTSFFIRSKILKDTELKKHGKNQ